MFGGIGGEALNGAFLPFLCPLPLSLADWDIPFLMWWLRLQSSPQIHRNALGIAWKQWIAFKSPSKLLHLHIQLTLNQLRPCKWQKEIQKFVLKQTRMPFSALYVSYFRDSCLVFGTRYDFVSDLIFFVSCFRIRLKVESATNSDWTDSIPTGHEGPPGRIRFLKY